jgi:hypothetical protein
MTNSGPPADALDPQDQWCVECRRNVYPWKGGQIMITVAIVLLIVLGGFIGVGFSILASVDIRAGIGFGVIIGLLFGVAAVGGEDRRCPICKSKNLVPARR